MTSFEYKCVIRPLQEEENKKKYEQIIIIMTTVALYLVGIV